jgi:16S rRNA (cytidine1402-2'-O)-methyltransferase
VERRAALCRELTKLHEEIWRGTLNDLARRANEQPPRGEVTIVVDRAPAGLIDAETSDDALRAARLEVERLVGSGMARGAAAKVVSEQRGVPRRSIYGS